MRSDRSSTARPASGLVTIAQTATRVTGVIASRPPSIWITSLKSTRRRSSISGSGQAREIIAENELCLRRRQCLTDEIDWIGFTERERCIATHHDVLDGYHLGEVSQDLGL